MTTKVTTGMMKNVASKTVSSKSSGDEGKVVQLDSTGGIPKALFATEGTWTPVVKIGTTVITSSGGSGSYTQIGNRVFITGTINFNRGTNTGDLTIEGLPVTSASGKTSVLTMSGGSYLDFAPALRAIVSSATTTVTPQRIPASTTATIFAMNDTHIKASTEVTIYLSGSYEV
tara:strand:- start:357 stop:875 length:519 start_codon:yes stop_codon:yes gene_type:complete